MAVQESIGEKVRALRLSMKLTQSELAGADFTKSFISQIEKGLTRPSLKSLEIIARRLNQPVSYFLGEVESTRSLGAVTQKLNLAKTSAENGQKEAAINHLEDAFSLCASTDHATKGDIRLEMGNIFQSMEQYEKAISQFKLAVEELRSAPNSARFARANISLGIAQYLAGYHRDAIQTLESACDHISRQGTGNKNMYIDALCLLSNLLIQEGQWERALQYSNQALNLTGEETGYYNYGKINLMIGTICDALGEFNKAFDHSRRAFRYFEVVENTDLAIAAMINCGIHLRNLGQCESSSKWLQRAYDRASSEKNYARAAWALAERAIDGSNGSDEPLNQLMSALKLDPANTEAPKWIARISECAKSQQIGSDLLDLIEEVAKKWRGRPRARAELHSNIGELYGHLGMTEKANQHLARSVTLYKES